MLKMRVAPLAGAWIEIRMEQNERAKELVAPLAGAWIEITVAGYMRLRRNSRPPRGGVD